MIMDAEEAYNRIEQMCDLDEEKRGSPDER
jgi:hypothetical protein